MIETVTGILLLLAGGVLALMSGMATMLKSGGIALFFILYLVSTVIITTGLMLVFVGTTPWSW